MKKPLIIGLSLLLYTNIQAQETGHHLYLNTGGGLHNLSYDLKNGNEKGSCGYSFNAGYGYFFNEHWGVQAGLGLQSFKPTATLNYQTGLPSTDADGTAYEYRTFYNSWKEQQRLLFLDIPLGVQYRYKLNEKFRLLASAGLKISVPIKTTYKSTGGEIITTGFYSQWNVELKEMPQHGFNNITDQLKGDVSLKTSYSGFADLGALYGLAPRLDLYAGGSISYGLNNMLKSDKKLVYQQDGVYNGVLASDQTDKARTVSLGLKVGVLWRFGYKKAIVEPATQAETVEALPVVGKAPIVEKLAEPTEAPKVIVAEQPVVKPTAAPVAKPKDDPYLRARAIAASTVISFKFNSNKPLNSEDSRIKELSAILKANPGIKLTVVGHTDSYGSRKVNYKMGVQRAETVRQKFLKNGVPGSQLKSGAKAFDKSQPTNTSNEIKTQYRVVKLNVE